MAKNKHAQALAKKRHLSMTPERRKEIATIAVTKRWANRYPQGKPNIVDNK